MPLSQTVLFFGVPAAIGVLGLYVLMPALAAAGLSLLANYLISFVGMFPLLLVASLVAYRLEGNPVSWRGLRQRFRLFSLDRREWLWTLGLLVVFVGGQILLMPTATWLATALPLPIPEGLPHVLDPRVAKTTVPTDFWGLPLQDNWSLALLHLTILVFNILSEEFWWRGYVLPRQELVHGRWTWVVHGVAWTLFHMPMWWNLLALLPSTLSLAYVTQRLKNTTPGIIAHSAMNGLGLVITVLGILG
jgi:membrane protease YdiL (CAAX protease family)